MSHEITKNDHLVLTGKKAWHGLGTVVEEAPSPEEALRLARLDWMPVTCPLEATAQTTDGEMDANGDLLYHRTTNLIASHKALVRSDDPKIVLGVVGRNYVPIDNYTLAELCYQVSERWLKETGNDLKVESAGSMKEGRRVWFLLRANPFSVGNNDRDVVERYTLAYNGFDGYAALSFLPTSVRVVCNNTASAALEKDGWKGIRLKHTANIERRVNDAMRSLTYASQAMENYEAQAQGLGKSVATESKARFYWDEVYTALLWPKSKNPEGLEGERWVVADRNKRATIDQWQSIMDRECDTHGLERSMWTAYNAVTNWFDHESPVRLSKEAQAKGMDTDQRRIELNLFGGVAAKKAEAMKMALLHV